MTSTLIYRLNKVLDSDCAAAAPDASAWPPLDASAAVDRADRLLCLLSIYDLYTAPLERLGGRADWAGHPAIAALKRRLEQEFRAELETAGRALDVAEEPVAAIRSLAAKDRLPRVYRWLARGASIEDLREFLVVEGGPDGGFDDLVALCQVGLSGAPKMELARNYWDEMGNGSPAEVHTDLHRAMGAALALPGVTRESLPEAALARAVLGGMLATNRQLQPEMIGALGLTELQAGPRCRLVLQAFRRLGVPSEAETFYAVHADVDPRHGKDWLENVVAPLATDTPEWGPRMVRGAAWRWIVNAELFDELGEARPVRAAA
jgi:hypothetical protein